MPDKRTATSDTYELHSGLLETRVYDTPVNYEDAEGEWQPIEEGLTEGEDGDIVNGPNSVEVSLPSELQEGFARVTIGDQWIGSCLLATETEPAELSEGAAVYESPEADTSFEYTTLPDGLKEEIELEGPSSPSSFHYELTASSGLHAELAEDGSVVFKDEHGEAVASLPAPTVADAQSVAPTSEQVSYQLAPREDGAWILTVSVDPQWLSAPDRTFPVRIDPTVTAEKSDLDCVIGGKTGQEGWIDCSSWGREDLLAGYNAELNQAEDSWYRSLMNLSTAEIPKGADVSSADLMLYAPEAAQNTAGVAVHRVLKPWTWQANWKRYTLGHNWEAEGGDYAPEALGELRSEGPNHKGPGTGPGWWSVPIQAAKVQEKSEHDEDLSVIVKLLDDKSRSCSSSACTHRLLKFESSASRANWHRPYLRVVYDFRAAPASSKMISPEEGRVSSHEFTLSSSWPPPPLGEPGVTGVTYQLKLPLWDGFRTIPAKYVRDHSGEEVDWPISPLVNGREIGSTQPVFFDFRQALVDEEWSDGWWAGESKTLKLRAVFAGGESSKGAIEPVTVTYDEDGAPTDATASVGPLSLDLLSGNYTLGRTDVSIPVPGSEASLEFTRVYENFSDARASAAFGRGWQPSAPVEQGYEGSAWMKLIERHQPAVPPVFKTECWEEGGIEECETYEAEEEIPAADWIELFDNEGGTAAFEIAGGNYVAPEYMKEYILTKNAEGNFLLTSAENVRTIFKPEGAAGEYVPKSVSWQATTKSARLVYEPLPSIHKYLLKKEIAPAPEGVECTDEGSVSSEGCRTLTFQYTTCSCEGTYRLYSIEYYGPAGTGGQTVARYGYDTNNRLVEEWDPRTALPKETYSYTPESIDQLSSLTPPGQAPWQFTYYTYKEFEPEPSSLPGLPGRYSARDAELFWRLKSVSRASLLESTPTATTTVAYQVPISGSGAPYDLSPGRIAAWGERDYPVDATAVFPPDQVPGSPRPSDFSHATVHYLDPEGYEVNTASPAPPGAGGPAISTTETDQHGNVVRELTPQNRLRALAAGSESVSRSYKLESWSSYSSDGTELWESEGPKHQVRLENGEEVEARLRRKVRYDERAPTPPAGTPPAHMPSSEHTWAEVEGRGQEYDIRATTIENNYNLRKPLSSTIDPGGEAIITRGTVYDGKTGLPIRVSQPKGSGAGTTKFVYYSAGANVEYPECGGVKKYAGLPCRITPEAQETGTGRPELLVKKFTKYNNLDEPEEIVESPGGGSANVRKTLLTYDEAARQKTKKIEGGGQAIPKIETDYSTTLGMPTAERFKCESECGNPQFLTSLGLASQSHTALKSPSDVAVDASGNVWTLDKGNNRIVEYNEAGEFIREAGGLGSGAGKLSSPSAIDVDSNGNVWVADTANNRAVEFSVSGSFLETFGSNVNKTKVEAGGSAAEKNLCTAASGNTCQAGTAGSSAGQLKAPLGIASPSTGGVWVVDTGNSRLEKFNKETGANTAVVSGEGTEAGKLKAPSAIAFASNGWFWVADTGNNRIEEWNSGFGYERQVKQEAGNGPEFNSPAGIAVDAGKNVWVVQQGINQVQKFSESGASLLRFGKAGSEEGKFSFGTPSGPALDGKGNVLVADPGNNRVQKWSTTGFDSQETKTTYDALGRPEAYEDADGNVAKTTYDLEGRPTKTTDNTGSQTIRYDATSGLPVELEDSAAGKFTASYNADGSMVKRTLPDGLTAETTYDPAGEPMHLSYAKASSLWLDFGLERAITGQILTETGTLGTEHYRYDKAGRLTYADETPKGGQCTTRAYTYDADSNRLSKSNHLSALGGPCTEAGSTTQPYKYDAADRLEGPTYDSWGRITSLPAEFAGGKTLTTGYFSNDMVAVQSQGGVSNMFQLDASLRQRQRLQGGGLEGTEVFHYDGSADSPVWTERGSSWTRSIVGIGGELAAIQESGKEVTLQLVNLHGDVAASAAVNPQVTSLKQTFTYDEFGNPTSGSAGRFGWLGGKHRRSELASGVIQMGRRSYVPSLGRFLSPDPVFGGSANPYDYAYQDPVNNFDLNGEKCAGHTMAQIHRCEKWKLKAWAKRSNKNKAIVLHFETKRGAERFLHYLQHASDFIKPLVDKLGRLEAQDLRILQKKAEEEAGPLDDSPVKCSDVATGLGTFGVVGGVAAAPESAGTSLVISTVSGIGALIADGASRAGLC